MSEVLNSVTVMEVAHASEMQENLRRKLAESNRKDSARSDSIRASTLGLVVQEYYDTSKEELRMYIESKAAYPAFQARVERYAQHCSDLIQAIQTKRNFPGLASLSLSKQQELHERVLEHFEELKQNLKQIEKIEREGKLVDVRSTVWVIRMLTWATMAILAAAFIADLRSGMLTSTVQTTSSILDDASTWLVEHLPI